MLKVSVIIPVYNVERYLNTCLNSVLRQTLKEFEIICIDDCSTDKSWDILREYANKDSRVKIIKNERNLGPSVARNRGLDMAKGEYIFFLDSDDFIFRDALECFYIIASVNKLDLLKTGYLVQQEDGDKTENIRGREIKGVYTGRELLVQMEKHENYVWSVCMNFLNRKFLFKNHIKFYDGILHEDVLFSYETYFYAKRSMYVTQSKYVYRKRPSSRTTSNVQSCNLYGYLVAMDEILNKGFGEKTTKEFKRATLSYLMRMYREGQKIADYIGTDINNDDWSEEVKILFQMFYGSEKKMCIGREKIREYIKDFERKKVIVYGAGGAASELLRTLQEEDIAIDGVAVTDTECSRKTLYGHRVHNIDFFEKYKQEMVILVAITSEKLGDVIEQLMKNGFDEIIYVCDMN